MKKLISILAILTFFGQVAFGDCILKGNTKEEGKIKLVASGLILLNKQGVDNIYKREVSDDYFNDTIFYKTTLFNSKTQEIPCRISKINKTNIEFYKKGNELEKISKLRVKNVVMNIFEE